MSDLLGRALGKMDVTVESAMRSSDGLTIMSNTKLAESKDDHTVYEVNMMTAKPARGFYDLMTNAGTISKSRDSILIPYYSTANHLSSKLCLF